MAYQDCRPPYKTVSGDLGPKLVARDSVDPQYRIVYARVRRVGMDLDPKSVARDSVDPHYRIVHQRARRMSVDLVLKSVDRDSVNSQEYRPSGL